MPNAILDPTGLSQRDAQAGLELAPRRADLSGVTGGPARERQAERAPVPDDVADCLRERYGAGEATLRRKENFAAAESDELIDQTGPGVRSGGDRRWRLRLLQRVGGRRRRPLRASRHTGSGDLLRAFRATGEAMAEIQGAPAYPYATTRTRSPG